jgi:hypothetical protein
MAPPSTIPTFPGLTAIPIEVLRDFTKPHYENLWAVVRLLPIHLIPPADEYLMMQIFLRITKGE